MSICFPTERQLTPFFKTTFQSGFTCGFLATVSGWALDSLCNLTTLFRTWWVLVDVKSGFCSRRIVYTFIGLYTLIWNGIWCMYKNIYSLRLILCFMGDHIICGCFDHFITCFKCCFKFWAGQPIKKWFSYYFKCFEIMNYFRIQKISCFTKWYFNHYLGLGVWQIHSHLL